MEIYQTSLTLLAALIALMVAQAFIATIAHRKQSSYIPGIVKSELDHSSFVFRSHRTFMNSLENVPLFILSAIVAMLLQVDSNTLFYTILVFLVARVVHMVLFYVIATNRNPSPRSYFFMIGFFTQVYLLYLLFAA